MSTFISGTPVWSDAQEIDALRQQFAAANTLINKYREETTSLRQQVVDRDKHNALLQEALVIALERGDLFASDVAIVEQALAAAQASPTIEACRQMIEAQAATDLHDVILCHAEPIAHMYQHDEVGRVTFLAMPDRMNERRWHEVPLYIAREPT